MNKKYNNNNIIIASRIYFLQDLAREWFDLLNIIHNVVLRERERR
jgi:hypothetical protein